MKKALLMAVALVLFATPAAAQGGYFGLFSDTIGENCTAVDVPGLLEVYVVHMDSPGATAAEFSIDSSGAPALDWLADTAVFDVTVGSSPSGVGIGYGTCLTSPIHILTVKYFASGLSAPCSVLRVVEHPDTGAIRATDCEFNFVAVEGRGMFINPTPDCEDCDLVPVGTEQNTWGSLKSIFR